TSARAGRPCPWARTPTRTRPSGHRRGRARVPTGRTAGTWQAPCPCRAPADTACRRTCVDVRVRRVQVHAGEVVEVAWVGRGGPGAAEDLRIARLQPQRGPAAGGVALQEAAAGLRIHAIGLFQLRDQLGG